jgi:DNA invertase Pin-like site-specific DNA recombinase
MLEGRQPLAKALVVAKLDRLSRSLVDFGSIMERARKKGWSLAALDLGVDATTPAGKMIANAMATIAQFERHLIGERTKAALAVRKAQGAKLERPRALAEATRTHKRMRSRTGRPVSQPQRATSSCSERGTSASWSR